MITLTTYEDKDIFASFIELPQKDYNAINCVDKFVKLFKTATSLNIALCSVYSCQCSSQAYF